jgi:hypothetical protein
MRPRLSVLSNLGAILIFLAAAPAARAQSNVPGTWSTDPQCSPRALRVMFGRDTLTMERNGRLIYRGGAQVAISEEAIAVRLAPGRDDAERPGPDRNVIRFSRGNGAIRMVPAAPGGASHPRVPPLYPCSAPGAGAVATVPGSGR